MILKTKTEILFCWDFLMKPVVEIVTCISETYTEPCQISMIELFAKIVNSFQQLTVLVVIYFDRKLHHRGSTYF